MYRKLLPIHASRSNQGQCVCVRVYMHPKKPCACVGVLACNWLHQEAHTQTMSWLIITKMQQHIFLVAHNTYMLLSMLVIHRHQAVSEYVCLASFLSVSVYLRTNTQSHTNNNPIKCGSLSSEQWEMTLTEQGES